MKIIINILRQRHHKNVVFIIALLLTISSCASLDSDRMVVRESAKPDQFSTNQSIRKIKIRGEQEEVFGGPAYAQKEQILKATETSLRHSGLFNSINQGAGNLTLEIIVRSQDQDVSMMLEYRAIITISYKFTDQYGKTVWFKTYESEFSSHAFSGATRTVEAREGSVRENLIALIEGIKSTW